MIDPIKFRKLLLLGLKILIAIELLAALNAGMSGGGWGRLGLDLIIAGILYIGWERIRSIVRDKKEVYRKKMLAAGDNIRLLDALAFSLLWSDEIYRDIPGDRKRLIVISYTLIALGLIAVFLNIGSGLMPLIIAGTLVLGAVNLLAWVVSSERGERESLQTELKLAHDVQVSLMPKEHPQIPHFDIAGRSLPAREVGGDHYAYTCIGMNEGMFGISVFDVSGKGMQAAMTAVFTSGAFSTEARQSHSAAEILSRLNRAVYTHSRRGHFVAFLMAVLEIDSGNLTFSNAGQLKPLLKSNDRLEWLSSSGVHFPLGMVPDSAYEESQVCLQSGDVLVLLTDGITEAMNNERRQFEMEGVERCLAGLDCALLSAEQIIGGLLDAVRAYTDGAPQHDDMTVVVVKAGARG
jgi:serine phosphatase RsbU (regulator of sigma subunit)